MKPIAGTVAAYPGTSRPNLYPNAIPPAPVCVGTFEGNQPGRVIPPPTEVYYKHRGTICAYPFGK